ncbi:MucBP domain-containing protein [Levilactobacillus wangkuiensis]|uniref:MucBP domain-containing protein n=1 Tax=Levilactobacillus wangkuiensis TaxID=2799566 RepID=UPI0019452886|nr:MucBP domain-containing protein [Levilactobacillus wangkuiensis]
MFNTKEHYKMYKKGKTWIFASIVTATLALGAFGGQTAHADTSDAATTGEETATKESVEPAKQVTLGQEKQSQTSADAAVKEDTGATDETTPSDGTKDPVVAPAKESETTPASDATGNSAGDTTDKNGDADLPAAPDADKTGSTDSGKVTEKPAADAPVDQTKNEVTPPTDTQPVTPVNTAEKVNPRLRSMAAPTPTPAVTAAQPVAEAEESIDQWMPNKLLQQAVLDTFTAKNNYLNPEVLASDKTWSSVNDITQADMLLLNYLDVQAYTTTYIDGKTSFSLEGLQYATNLTHLDLANDMDAAPYAMRGDITDLTPLSSLVNLQWLQFTLNRVSDITPITGLKKLTSLSMSNNSVADFSGLNPAQFTDGFSIGEQYVVNNLVFVPRTGSYIMTNPVKAPQGSSFIASTPGGAVALPISAPVPGNATPTVRIFWVGAVSTVAGNQITYSDIKDQIMPGQTYNPLSATYPYLVQEDYTYFLDSVFSDTNTGITVAMVTPYVKADAAEDVTVNYVDESGQKLADPETLTGLIGEGYTAPTKEFAGYELTETPANATGTFSDTAQTVTFVYKEATSSVTVHYQDEAGTMIQADTVASGQVGTAYDIAHPDITGYTYKETQGDAQGTYTDTPTEVTFVYTKNAGTVTPPVVTPDQTITVTVHYQTADGTTVAPDVLVTGKAGDTYTTSPAANVPDGYKLVTTPANASGTLGDSDFSVTYVYEETGGDGDKVTPDTDKPTTKPTKPGTKPATKPAATKKTPAKKTQAGGQADALTSKRGGKTIATVAKGGAAAKVDLTAKTSTQANHPAASKSAAADLPQTNSSEQTSPFWGVALLVAVLGVFGFKFKRKEQ